MARIDQRKGPYYGEIKDFDYTQLLYKPGYHVQAGELNEQQLIQARHLKELSDTVFKDGDLVEGCQIIINGTSVKVTGGKLYLEGIVRQFKEQEVEIKGIGLERIGVKVSESIIDSNIDDNLLSKAAGFSNYGLAGADRLKQEVILTVDDDEAATIYLINDGKLVNEAQQPDNTLIDRLNQTLARRTYDESGHYKVWGLNLSQKSQVDEEHLYLSISEGKAYVLGWEIDKTTASTVELDKATDIRDVVAEIKLYRKTSNRYYLNNNPVKRVKRLSARIQKGIQMTRQGAVNGSDPIDVAYTPVVEIQKIENRDGSGLYTRGVDYVLEGNSVRWLAGGKQPSLGASYSITFTYSKVMENNTNYRIRNDNGDYYIEMIGTEKPVDGSEMQIDYEFYLSYMASITMDKDGMMRAVKGQSDTFANVAPPDISDQSVLLLGQAIVRPLDDTVLVYNSKNLRTSMSDIIRMAERLDDLEINQATTDLDEEAMEGEEPSLLKGIFTDGFLGFTKSDINHPDYSASIDIVNRYLTLGFKETAYNLGLNQERSNNIKKYGSILTASSSEVKSDNQPYATKTARINPYTSFIADPVVKITPSIDSWIETNNIIIEKDGGQKISYEYLSPNIIERTILDRNLERVDNQGEVTIRRDSRTEKSSNTSVINSAIEFMRPIDIDVQASGFEPRQRGIVVTFNDIKVLTNLVADTQGNVKGKFKVPANTRCGSVAVRVYALELPSFVGSTIFTANGQIKTTTTTTTTTTVTTVYKQKRITRYVDPISQTFSLDKDQILNSIGIYFSDIERNKPVRVQIRECDNGYPSNVVLGETVINQELIKISNKADIETIAKFDDPIYLRKDTQYAFTVLTTSDRSSLWVQELNGKDVTTGQIISKNPYVPGLMFSSSNALTWTAHQSQNIKFNLYINNYRPKATIYFNSLSNIDLDNFTLLADTSVPVDTSLTWEYSLDGGKTYKPTAIDTLTNLQQGRKDLDVKATMVAGDYVSPAINLESLLLIAIKYKTSSSYVSKNVTTDTDYTKIKIIADVDAPSGTGVIIYYATDINGKDWKPLTQEGDGKVKVVGSYTEYTYTATVSASRNFRVKVDMSTNNTSIRPRVKNLKCIIK